MFFQLKKRQQQKKAAGSAVESSANTPSPPISRVLSPAPSQAQATNDTNSIINEFGEMYKISLDGELQASSRVYIYSLSPKTPPGDTQNVVSATKVGQTISIEKSDAEKLEEYSKQLEDQNQTISLLVSEKASLAETLERLQGVDASTFHCLKYNIFVW